MLKEIKIIEKETGAEILPEKENLVCIPINGKIEFVTIQDAQDLLKIIRGQLNIIRAQRIERKTGCLEY
jgi:hypothetical protein